MPKIGNKKRRGSTIQKVGDFARNSGTQIFGHYETYTNMEAQEKQARQNKLRSYRNKKRNYGEGTIRLGRSVGVEPDIYSLAFAI